MGRHTIGALLALAAGAAATSLSTDLAALDLSGEKPIAKVVRLLTDMQAQLETEGKEDEEMYDKMACWCETNDKEKTKAIEDGNQKTKQLSAAIEEATAASSTLEVDITSLKGEAESLTKTLAEAEALREKESAEFNAQEKDAIQSIASLKGAIMTLGKQQASSMVQREALLQVGTVLHRNREAALAAVAPHQRETLRRLMRTTSSKGISLIQEGSTLQSQDSGAIFGILQQMKESFETNMVTSTKEEEQAKAEYASLKSAKGEELKAASDQVFTKGSELSAAKEKAARSKEDLEDTTAALAADTEFLGSLKEQCATVDNEFAARRKARAEEITAVGETIGILTDDDAKDQFAKSTFFLQVHAQSKREASARRAAASSLAAAGKRLRSRRLSYLAVRMANDAFTKVKENIDNMVGQLSKEKQDEIQKKDGCVSDINTNEKQTMETTDAKEDKETEAAGLDAEIAALKEEVESIKTRIADAHMELKKAAMNRETENKEFQTTIADQQATQAILKKALDKMSAFYAKKAAFLQARQAPPGGFAKQKPNAGGTGVIALLETIIDESKDVEKDALAAENDAQVAYESFVKDTNDQLAALSAQITNDVETEAKDTKLEVADQADIKEKTEGLNTLGEMASTLHGNCDGTIKGFDSSQAAREEEMDALKESKAIFSSAASSLMQTGALQ